MGEVDIVDEDVAVAVQASVEGRFVDVDPPDPPGLGERVLVSWLAAKKPGTRTAYRAGLRAFADFVGAADDVAAINGIVDSTPAQAFEIAGRYREYLQELGLAPATVRRLLSTLASLAKHANTLGLIAWKWSIPLPRASRIRDVQGPPMEVLGQVQRALAEADDPLAIRDRAIFALLVDVGLRRAEISGLDLEHVDLERRAVSVLRKREDEREAIPLADETVAAVATWLDDRGVDDGPLFWRGSGSRVLRGHRLSGQGIWLALRARSLRAGVGQVRPHAVRHSVLSELADRGVPLPQLLRFSGHRSVGSIQPYLDSAADRRRELSGVLASVRCSALPETEELPPRPASTFMRLDIGTTSSCLD